MKKYTFEELVDIVEKLCSKDGCPWDSVQTHESLRPYMMEEAAELLGAIRIYQETGSAENMQEELGDILFQSVIHSVIARKEGLFTMEDVITGISEKMIHRHPHVFPQDETGVLLQELPNWEELKKKEKEGKSWIKSPLQEIPKELPSLTRAVKVAKKLDNLSQYYDKTTGESTVPSTDDLLHNLEEEVGKLKSNATSEDIVTAKKEEIEQCMQKMLRTIGQLSYRMNLKPEQLLFDDIEEIIAKSDAISCSNT